MHFPYVEEDATLLVADEGIIGKAVPQTCYDVIEFTRPRIAFAMLDMLVQTKISCRVGVGGGHDVPRGASIADVIQRGEAPRHVIGFIESGRRGGREADLFG